MTRTRETSISKHLPTQPEASFRYEDLPKLTPEENRLLAKHFEVFSETTNKLVAAHQHLQGQIKVLMEELERKNEQLEAVNRELARKIREEGEVREFLDRLIDSMHTGLVAVDSEGNLTRMNQAARRLLGWEERKPARIEDLLEKDRASPLVWDGSHSSDPRSGEARLRKHESGTLLVRYSAVPITDPQRGADSTGVGTLIVFEDLSRLRLLEEKVRRSDRLAALGELAAGVAHEMRNPLATMRGFLQLLPTEYEDAEFREECSTRLIQEIDRLSRLTDDLLELSRPIQLDDLSTDLREVVEEVLADQSEMLRTARIRVVGETQTLPSLPLDRERIKQVLLNLVINARQAMPEGGFMKWRLESRKEIWGEGEKRPLACLSISDTGAGIESRHMDALFDPFFTTKAHGTGLGLAICHRIVEEHGGFIRVESEKGKGSTFTLYFPFPSGKQ